MLVRLEDSLVRGELDCRMRGRVSGRLWLLGRSDPLDVELSGIPGCDLAGLRFKISCEFPPTERAPTLHTPQVGKLLSCTASERRKVPEGADQEIAMRVRKRIPQEWRHRSVFHLEWIDPEGFRCVLEGTGVVIHVLDPAEWRPAPEEEAQARHQAERLRREWADGQAPGRLSLPEIPEEPGPVSDVERDADREHDMMERLNDRIQSRLEKLEDFDEEQYDRIYQEERERIRREFGEPEPEPLTPEQEEERARWVEEMNRMTDEALAEWESGDYTEPDRHPLQVQCDGLQEKVFQDLRDGGWLPEIPGEEHPLREINWGLHMATAKLAGGLGMAEPPEWPPRPEMAGPILVRLKQVRGYLGDVLTALDAADEENLGVSAWRRAVRHETAEILHEVQIMIGDVRERLA